MRALDKTKEYYLGNLSDEQLIELVEYLSKENNAYIFYYKDFSIIKKHIKNNNRLATNKDYKTWGLYPEDYWGREVVDALELFELKLKIGDTFEYNGFVCEVKEKIEEKDWFLLKNKHTKSITYRYAKEKEYDCFNNDEDYECIKITNKEFIKQLEENAR